MSDFNVPTSRVAAPNRARSRLRNLVAVKNEIFNELRSNADRVRANRERVAEIKREIAPHAELIARYDWSASQNNPVPQEYENVKMLVSEGTEEIDGLNEERLALEARATELTSLAAGFGAPADALVKHLNIDEARLGVA